MASRRHAEHAAASETASSLQPHFAREAKRARWPSMHGGPSHVHRERGESCFENRGLLPRIAARADDEAFVDLCHARFKASELLNLDRPRCREDS